MISSFPYFFSTYNNNNNNNKQIQIEMESETHEEAIILNHLIQSKSDIDSKIKDAAEIRRLTKTSHRSRRRFSSAVPTLVDMLRLDSVEANEAALLALLNLAVRDETNKIYIVNSGALSPILKFLNSENKTLLEHATASLLTLSASFPNKPIIALSGAIPLLVKILKCGNSQAKSDSVLALYNLSTYSQNLTFILEAQPIPFLVDLLTTFKKISKATEKGTALIESLMGFDEGRIALTEVEGGVLVVVEVLESGSLQGREHAVGALLTMCEEDRDRYREVILGEGVIPGLLELTVHGTPKSEMKAKTLLRLLRVDPHPRSDIYIVSNILCQMEGEDQSGKAKKMVAEMVQVSMEQSLRHLQQRALVCSTTTVVDHLPIQLPLE